MRAQRSGITAPRLTWGPGGLHLGPSEPSPLVAAVRGELAAAGRVNSVLGQQALHLAARLAGSSFDTGSSIAALSKELTSVMALALKDVVIVDPLDELMARRDRRRGLGN